MIRHLVIAVHVNFVGDHAGLAILFALARNQAFFVKEYLPLLGKAVLFIGLGIAGTRPVALKLAPEQFLRLCNHFFFLCGQRTLFRLLVVAPCHNSIDTVCRQLEEVAVHLLLLILVRRLSAICAKAADVGGIQRGRTGINRVKKDIQIEQNVFDAQRCSVGELDAVLDCKIIRGVVIVIIAAAFVIRSRSRGDVGIVERHAVRILTAGNIAVLIGGQHTDLGQTDHASVRTAGVVKRIEYAVQRLAGNCQRRVLIGNAGRRFVAVTVPRAGSVSALAALARHCQRQDCADREQQTENPQKFLFLHHDSSFLLFSFSWFCWLIYLSGQLPSLYSLTAVTVTVEVTAALAASGASPKMLLTLSIFPVRFCRLLQS